MELIKNVAVMENLPPHGDIFINARPITFDAWENSENGLIMPIRVQKVPIGHIYISTYEGNPEHKANLAANIAIRCTYWVKKGASVHYFGKVGYPSLRVNNWIENIPKKEVEEIRKLAKKISK